MVNNSLNFTYHFSRLFLCLLLFLAARPAYSIPTSLDEFQQLFGNLCQEYGLEFCAAPPKEEKKDEKSKEFTETEKEILTRLSQQQERIIHRGKDLDRREQQLKALQEDVQRQITQLEKLQQEIVKNIDSKKQQDDAMLDKVVGFYAKMPAATAAESIGKLETKVAVAILMRMKEKQASEVLANMPAEQSAKMIAEIAKKKK